MVRVKKLDVIWKTAGLGAFCLVPWNTKYILSYREQYQNFEHN